MDQLIQDDHVDPSGSPALHIPTEVCENTIDMLYSEDTRDTIGNIAALHRCALVCRAWRVRAQRMLFYLVQLSNTTSFHRLSAILDAAQHLRDYDHHIELTGYHLHNTTSIFTIFPVVFAGKLPNLERVNIVHLQERHEIWLPRTPYPPKARSLPYIPLHPRFPRFLSCFTAVSVLQLEDTTLSSFSEFARMLHGFPNLEDLRCIAVRWINPGGPYPGADSATQPGWANGRRTLSHFAPKLRDLMLEDVAVYGPERLISTRGPDLTRLDMTVPLSYDPEGPTHGIDLGPCTGLQTLIIALTPQFSIDAHSGFVTELLASWKPQHPGPVLIFRPHREDAFTRQAFADVLRGLGTITEAWLQTFEEPPAASEPGNQYRLRVDIYDWEVEKEWWSDHLKNGCFPTWLRTRRLFWKFDTPQLPYNQWANEKKSLPSDAILPSGVEEVDSYSPSLKDAPLPQMTEPA